MNKRFALSFVLGLGSASSFLAMLTMTERPAPYAFALFILSVFTAVLAYSVIRREAAPTIRGQIRVGLSSIAGALGLLPLAALFDHMNWPVFNSWSLGHGLFILVGPAIGFLFHFLLGMIPWLKRGET